jgi:starvation-inducible DNA-binding protein
MIAMNQIGLESSKAKELTGKLNDLLANYQIYYQNLRGFHWNIKGQDFFQLHIKFEQLYTEAHEIIDEIAERILTLGGAPQHAFSSYLATADIKESKNCSDAIGTVQETVNDLSILIRKERDLLRLADDAEDEGTTALVSEYIKNQEKQIWMLSAFLNK